MTPDLKQLQELLAKLAVTQHAHTYASENADIYHAYDSGWQDCVKLMRPAIDALLTHRAALLASHEALSAETGEQGSLLASTTDLLNTWARESNVTEAQNEKGIRDLVDRLWSKLSGELCAQRRQIEALSAEVAGLRDAGVAMLAKLDQVEKDTAGIFVMAHVHGADYKGANWGDEYKALRAAIDAAREGK